MALVISDSTDFAVRGLNLSAGCPGYCIPAAQRFVLLDSTIASVGDVSQGQGMGIGGRVEHFYIGNNSDTGNPGAPERWESMTTDGPSNIYNGSVGEVLNAAANSTIVLPAGSRVNCGGGGGASECVPAGTMVAILAGEGAGQIRRTVASNSSALVVAPPFDPPPLPGWAPPGDGGDNNGSYITVLAFHGNAVFEGNYYSNGTCWQIFGTGDNFVVAGNRFDEMFTTSTWNHTGVNPAGITLFALNYDTYEPNWRATVAYNSLTCATGFTASAQDADGLVLSLGHIFRGNGAAGGMNLSIHSVRDAVVEGMAYTSAACAYAGGQTLPAGQTLPPSGGSGGTFIR